MFPRGRLVPSAFFHTAKETCRARARGQAMIESVIALLVLFVCFMTAVQYADNLRARLLCEYAAGRCARAATIGLNDYMVAKTAHIATMAAAGDCLSENDRGDALGYRSWISRAPDYLECEYAEQARQVLDFAYWNDGRTTASATCAGSKITATVRQNRPQFFDLAAYLFGAPAGEDGGSPRDAHLVGTAEIEAHYPDWMQ